MIKEINLNKFIDIIGNQKNKKNIKLKIEGKKLKSGHNIVNVKSLIVTETLFDELGLKGDIVIERPVVKKAKNPSLRELIEGIATDVNALKTDMIEVKTDVNTLKTDMQAIKSLPTIKRELNAQKRLKTLKQK